MATYNIPLVDGIYTEGVNIQGFGGRNKKFGHQLAVSIDGTITAGSLTAECKSIGSETYEILPDMPMDLTAIGTVLFEFFNDNYRFTLSGVTGSGFVKVTDLEI